MSKDKKVLYILSLITFAALLTALFVDIGSSKIVTAILLLPITPIVMFLIKKRNSLSINKREVLLISAVVGVIYVILTQMTGLYFGFYKNPYFVNADIFLRMVLPLTVIIVAAEMIRYVFLAQKNAFASFITFLSCVLIEILMFSNVAGITTFNRFMDLVGLTLFPALSANIYYHYISKKYGMLPNIAFRIITTLYVYFVPYAAAIPDALSACIKIVLPILMLAFFSALYEKQKKVARKRAGALPWIGTAATVCVIVGVAMLISCQFRFGALVVATESMTGEINKGDMIIYEQYTDQNIEEGQVIVFLHDKSKIVHRVIKIERINGETRYYTKGDANEDPDEGYILDSDIMGLTDLKIAYIGYPTLWLREIIQN